MKNSFIIVVALLLGAMIITAAPVLAARNDRDWNYGRVTLTGVVVDTDSRRSELTVRFERYDTYKVRSDEANIRYSGRSYSFRDIRKGDTVRVYGDLSSNGYMDAYTIDVIDRNSRDDYYRDDRGRDRDWIGSIVTVRGNVRSIDRKRGILEVDTDQGRLRIIAVKSTDIREDGRKRSINDIRDGDYVVINGRGETNTSVRANAIDINGSDSRRRYPMDSVLVGEVSRESTMWDRDIKVRTPIGERTLKIPQGVDIIRAGRGISVHDLNRGETVRAVGRWSGDTFTASRVDVTSSREYGNRDEYNGKVERINYGNEEFMINFRGRRYYVEARNAEIIDAGRRVSFRDLKNGHDVWITGDIRGDTIYADIISRGDSYYRYHDRGTEYRPASYNR